MSAVTSVVVALIGLQATQDVVPAAWEFTERPGIAMASARYASGQALAIRCAEGQIETILAGAATTPDQLVLTVRFDDGPPLPQSWLTLQAGGVAYALDPRFTARQLAAASRVSIRVPASEGPARRFDLDLPASAEAITMVLDRCGASSLGPRDALTRVSSEVRWDRRPIPAYPDRALRHQVAGVVGLSCVVGEGGRPRNCQTEMVAPTGYGFETAAEQAAQEARLTLTDPGDEGRVVSFAMRFNMPR